MDSEGESNGAPIGPVPAVGKRPNATAHAVRSLRHLLTQEAWAPGDRLPSEPTLARELGVSRVSVRGALAQLESEGILNRRHGSGTYVNSVRPLVRSLHLNVGSDELIKSVGHVPGILEMSWRQEPADAEVADRLSVEPGMDVVHLYRVRTSDSAPVTISHDYFATSLLPAEPPSLGPSLYAFLRDACGVEVQFGVATLEPSQVGAEHASIFDVDPEEMCLIVKQVDYDSAERAVSYSVEFHLARAFDFRIIRQGPGPHR